MPQFTPPTDRLVQGSHPGGVLTWWSKGCEKHDEVQEAKQILMLSPDLSLHET